MKSLMKVVAVCAAMCGFAVVGSAADWTYDSSAKTITDGTWVLNVTWTEGDGALTIKSPATSATVLDLRDLSVNGTAITALTLAPDAFMANGRLTEFYANHVTGELKRTFAQSGLLKKIEIAGEGLTALRCYGNWGVCESCGVLESVKFDCPNLWLFDTYSFNGCSKLASDIMDIVSTNVTQFGSSVFPNTAVSGVLKLNECTSLGGGTFYNCKKLTGVEIGGGSLTSVPSSGNTGCFEGCSALERFICYGTNVTSAGVYAFSGCSNLRTLFFATKDAMTFSGTAFANCSKLADVTFLGTPPTQANLDILLGSVGTATGAKNCTVKASKRIGGGAWRTLASALTTTEEAVAPDDCFGVYREGSRKAWLVDVVSPYDPKEAGTVAVTSDPLGFGTPNVPYGTYEDVADGTAYSVGQYFISGTTLYRATGFRFAEYDSASDTWTDTASGSELSFTYRTNERMTRLTWTFEPCGGTVIIANKDASRIAVSPEPVFGNAYLAGTEVSLTASDYDEPAATFVKWYGNLPEGADVTSRTLTFTYDQPRSIGASYRTADWSYDPSSHVLRDVCHEFNATFDGTTGELTINSVVSLGAIVDLRDLVVNGVPVTALKLARRLFQAKTVLQEFYANHLAGDLYTLFYQCSSLRLIWLSGEGVTALTNDGGDGFCESVSSLKQVTFDLPNLKTIGKLSFRNTSLTQDVMTVVNPGLMTLGERAFSGSKVAGSLTLTNLTVLGGAAFYGTKLSDVELDGAFVSLPVSGDGAFESNANLTNFVCHATNMTAIGSYAFNNDTKLKSVFFATPLPITCEGNSFNSCSALSSATFLGTAPTQTMLDRMLTARNASDGAKGCTIYASKRMGAGSWIALAAETNGTEAALAPADCFGVYREGSRKAWLVDIASPFEPKAAGTVTVASEPLNLGTPNVPYGTYEDVVDGTLYSVERYFISGTTLYRATGFRYEEYDSDGDVWTTVASGAELSFAYHTRTKLTRLTWLFEPCGATLKITNSDTSRITVLPEPVFENAYTNGTEVTLSAADYESPAATFFKWSGNLPAGVDATQRTVTFVFSNALSVCAAYHAAEWTYANGVLSSVAGRLTATSFDAEYGWITITGKQLTDTVIDLRDLVVNGVPITALHLGTGAFHQNATLEELYANHIADEDLKRPCAGCSKLRVVDLSGDAVKCLWGDSWGCFEQCSALREIRLNFPRLENVSGIAFSGVPCTQDVMTVINPGVKSIGTHAFTGSGFTGDLVLTNLTSVGVGAFYSSKIESVDIDGPITAFPTGNDGLFEACSKITNMVLRVPGLTSVGTIFMNVAPSRTILFGSTNLVACTDSCFNGNLRTATFWGPAQSRTLLDRLMTGVGGTAGAKDFTVYASKKQAGWRALAEPLTDAEKEVAPAGCFGVYVTAGNARKAWLVHSISPYDPTGMKILFR